MLRSSVSSAAASAPRWSPRPRRTVARVRLGHPLHVPPEHLRVELGRLLGLGPIQFEPRDGVAHRSSPGSGRRRTMWVASPLPYRCCEGSISTASNTDSALIAPGPRLP